MIGCGMKNVDPRRERFGVDKIVNFELEKTRRSHGQINIVQYETPLSIAAAIAAADREFQSTMTRRFLCERPVEDNHLDATCEHPAEKLELRLKSSGDQENLSIREDIFTHLRQCPHCKQVISALLKKCIYCHKPIQRTLFENIFNKTSFLIGTACVVAFCILQIFINGNVKVSLKLE